MKMLFVLSLLIITLWAAVNINQATKKELTSLKGIGNKTADAIIAKRPYKSLQDLMKVKGIGNKKFEKIKGEIEL